MYDLPYSEKFSLVQISHIWPKSPQNKFSYVLISHARVTKPLPCSSPMAYSTACRGDMAPGLWAFLASVSIVRLIKSLWVGRSRIWHSIAVYHKSRSSPRVARSKYTQKFHFRMQKAHAKYAKISTMRKIPAIRYVGLASASLTWCLFQS